MPRYTKETAEAKAALLIKPYIRNGLDQSKTARELGVTSEAINQRLKRKPVQDYLRKFIDSPQLKRRLVTVAQEALRANKMTKKGNRPDHDVRHKYWHDLVTAGGVLKNDGAAGEVKIVNIIHNYREKKDVGSTDLYLAPFDAKDGVVNRANPTQNRMLEWIDRVRALPPDQQTHIPILYIQGGVGCGKTRGILAGVLELLTEMPGLNLLWGRQDFKDLKLSIMNKFFEIIPQELIASRNETYHWYDIETPDKPSRIFFSGLKDLTGLGSQEYAVIVINEVHEISEQIYRALKRRCRQAGKPVMILMEGEAPNENHWLAQITNPASENYDSDIETWFASTYENWENLPLAYRGSLESMPESWKAKYLLGKYGFRPDGKPYYNGYKEIIHAQDLEWIPERDLILGWDFGYHHPACIVTQIDLQDRWCWLREIIGNDITIDKFGAHVKQVLNYYYPNARVIHYGDPACIQKNDKSESTSWQILAAMGLRLGYRTSEYRLRKELIEKKLSTLISGKPSLLVDKRYCKTANDGFLGGYHYPEITQGQSMTVKFEAPFKDGFYEHIMNAGEYIAVNMFSPIPSRDNSKPYRKPKMNSGM